MLCVEFACRPVDGQACAFVVVAIVVFGDDVEVDVHDCLVCDWAVVLEDVVAWCAGGLFDGSADSWEYTAERGCGVVAEGVECFGGFNWDDERVSFGERADVEEGQDVVVSVDLVAGDVAFDDLGKDGVWHGGTSVAAEVEALGRGV